MEWKCEEKVHEEKCMVTYKGMRRKERKKKVWNEYEKMERCQKLVVIMKGLTRTDTLRNVRLFFMGKFLYEFCSSDVQSNLSLRSPVLRDRPFRVPKVQF